MGRRLPTSSHLPSTASWKVFPPLHILFSGSHVIFLDKDLANQNSAFKIQTIIFLLSPKHISTYFQTSGDFLPLSPSFHIWNALPVLLSKPHSVNTWLFQGIFWDSTGPHCCLSSPSAENFLFLASFEVHLRENNIFSKVKNFFNRWWVILYVCERLKRKKLGLKQERL